MATALGVVYDSRYDRPYYSGSAVASASLVPGTFPIAINGRPYVFNTNRDDIESYRANLLEDSLPLLRDQTDQQNEPGEQSLSPAQYWRRSGDDWPDGAGQSMLDRNDSIATRFSTSLGINPWTRYQLSLLNDTTKIRTTANSGLVGATANGQFYVADGTAVVGTANLTSFTTVTGTPANAAVDMCSDGALVYSAHGSNGIYTINGSTASSYVTGTVSHVGFAKGRLLAAQNGSLYNPTSAGALPTALLTVATTGWQWVAFCEGDTQIYAAGFAGDTSRIYRTAAVADGTSLAVPIVAASLPKGETVRSLLGYLGFVVVGTDKGVRFATASSTGDLTLGALIATPGPVYCLDAADRFIWFGWSNYDSTHTGLGRMDLQRIGSSQAPAYATDLMATGSVQGTVRALGAIGGRHVFSVDAVGVFAETAGVPVASGSFTTGVIAYGISDPKVPLAVDLKHGALPAGTSITVGMSLDRGAVATIGSSSVVGTLSPATEITTGARRAEEVEMTFTLNSSGGVGPVFNRWVLLSYPAPAGASMWQLPLVLAERVQNLHGMDFAMDPAFEYGFLRGLNNTREVITVQLGNVTFQGTMEDFVWIPERVTANQQWWNGTFVAKIRRIN